MRISNHLNKAFRILRRNYGCPGVDSLSYKTIKQNFSEHRQSLAVLLDSGTFNFSEPRKSFINTGITTPKVREIFVYNIYDRWVQETIRIELNNHLNKFMHPHVYSYIRGKNRRQAFEYILKCEPRYILILDLKDFSGSIIVSKLFNMLRKVNVPDDLLDMIDKSIKHTDKGLPKGNSITSVLSNYYLSSIDRLFPTNYCRFSDDLVFGMTSKKQQKDIHKLLIPVLSELGLELNQEKIKCIENNGTLNIINEYPWIINS